MEKKRSIGLTIIGWFGIIFGLAILIMLALREMVPLILGHGIRQGSDYASNNISLSKLGLASLLLGYFILKLKTSHKREDKSEVLTDKKGKIVIKRTSQLANKVRFIEFYVDDIKVGEIRDGEIEEFFVSPGSKFIYAKIDWCKIKPINLTINEGETKIYELGCNVKGWKLLILFYWGLFNTKEYLYLKEIAK